MCATWKRHCSEYYPGCATGLTQTQGTGTLVKASVEGWKEPQSRVLESCAAWDKV